MNGLTQDELTDIGNALEGIFGIEYSDAVMAKLQQPDVLYGWEEIAQDELHNDQKGHCAQFVNGRWYRPKFGCDSLAMALGLDEDVDSEVA